MIKIFKCETCGEVMGMIDKPTITQDDESKYIAMVTCSQKHGATVMSEDGVNEYLDNLEENKTDKIP